MASVRWAMQAGGAQTNTMRSMRLSRCMLDAGKLNTEAMSVGSHACGQQRLFVQVAQTLQNQQRGALGGLARTV